MLEERSAPDQIILSSRDPTFCCILGLAIHIEYSLISGSISMNTTLFGCSKDRISKNLKGILDADDFPRTQTGPLGSHSIRKLPATYARNNGCCRDDVEARGRWKSQKRIVDTYIGCSVPYPDAKVASVLFIG